MDSEDKLNNALKLRSVCGGMSLEKVGHVHVVALLLAHSISGGATLF